MATMIQEQWFPNTLINTIDGDGGDLTPRKKGAKVELWKREDGSLFAEVSGGDDDEDYAIIGLWFDGRKLVDYDGVFYLPKEVMTLLNKEGYNTTEMRATLYE